MPHPIEPDTNGRRPVFSASFRQVEIPRTSLLKPAVIAILIAATCIAGYAYVLVPYLAQVRLDKLLNDLQSSDVRAKQTAATTLGTLDTADPRRIPALIQTLGDSKEEVSSAAEESLVRIGPRCIHLLSETLNRAESQKVKTKAFAILSRFGPEAKPVLPGMMQHVRNQMRQYADRWIEREGHGHHLSAMSDLDKLFITDASEAAAFCTELIEHGTEYERHCAAAYVLQAPNALDLRPLLIRAVERNDLVILDVVVRYAPLMNSEFDSVRLIALQQLVSDLKLPSRALLAPWRALRDDQGNLDERQFHRELVRARRAIERLMKLYVDNEEEEIEQLLLQACSSDDDQHRLGAIYALRNFADNSRKLSPAVIERLTGQAQADAHVMVRTMARDTLNRVGTLHIASLPSADSNRAIRQWALHWLDDHCLPYTTSVTYDGFRDGKVEHSDKREPPNDAIACVSYEFDLLHKVHHSANFTFWVRCFLNDTALAVMHYALNDHLDDAERCLLVCEHLQKPDGGIGFSWDAPRKTVRGPSDFYNRAFVRSSAVARLGSAVTICLNLKREREGVPIERNPFLPLATKLAGYLVAHQVTDKTDLRYGLLKGGEGKWSLCYEKFESAAQEWCATSDQIEAYFFLRDLGKLTGNSDFLTAAKIIKNSTLEKLWNEEAGRFFSGFDGSSKVNRNDTLDANAMGIIFLVAIGERDKSHRAIKHLDEHFKSSYNDVSGYKPFSGRCSEHPVENWDNVEMVSAPGSLLAAMAHLKSGDAIKSRAIMNDVWRMQGPPRQTAFSFLFNFFHFRERHEMDQRTSVPGIRFSVYADDPGIPKTAMCGDPTDKIYDFLRVPSASGTLWMGLLATELENPGAIWGEDRE